MNYRNWQSRDRTNGGRQLPPKREFCGRCLSYRLLADMARETWDESPIRGKLVCKEPAKAGGCFEGPQVKPPAVRKPDNYAKTPNV